jgi:hypothetical protein
MHLNCATFPNGLFAIFVTILTYILVMKQHDIHVRSEVFMAVTMKSTVFWDVTSCGSCKNRHFGGTYCFPQPGGKSG